MADQQPHDFSTSVPTPPSTAGAGSEPEIVEKYEEETPTASHAFAEESVALPADSPSAVQAKNGLQEVGAGQIEHGDIEVKNLGWNDEARNVPRPVVGGFKNEELWTLVRRFDKQIFHVRKIDKPPLADLDMNIADEEEFSPDKLRAQLERLYMVVIVSLFSAWKHIVRLRSWREWQRTSAFLAVYAVAWLCDLLIPTVIVFLMTLILYPRSRDICFPPAPPSLIDPRTGGVQKPPAGVLASDDSITGAPEKHEGEAVEQEAHSFVNSISTLVISTAAGKHPQGDPYEDNSAPDPTELTEDVANAKDKTNGAEPTHAHDRTKKPVSQAVWSKARPFMHAIADLVDTWERFGNALSPVTPFPRLRPRLVLASVLVPVLFASYMTSSYALLKGMGFSIGFGFFGDPIITPGIEFVNSTYPKWQKYVELRNTLLRGIPTNAQLAVTLLRIGERNRAPLPPPPSSDVPPPDEAHETAGEGLEHLGTCSRCVHLVTGSLTETEGATEEEIQEAVEPSDEIKNGKEEKPRKPHRILNILKGTTKGGINTALAADKAKATAGARHAKTRLGAVKGKALSNPPTGPIRFPARYKGKKGHVYITATATTPAVSWTPNLEDVKPAWTVPIMDIDEVKKVGGLGWKSKILVGWATGREVVDGIMLKTTSGQELHVTAVSMRDELFNRLIAMGNQMWEAW